VLRYAIIFLGVSSYRSLYTLRVQIGLRTRLWSVIDTHRPLETISSYYHTLVQLHKRAIVRRPIRDVVTCDPSVPRRFWASYNACPRRTECQTEDTILDYIQTFIAVYLFVAVTKFYSMFRAFDQGIPL
jgi:hypothetical protein